jgi:hypothetical protein
MYASWLCLALLSDWSAALLTFPATAEVDLVFPRNDTYANTVLMPIVFAIQNSQLAASIDLFFFWNIVQLQPPNNNSVTQGFLALKYANISTDPYFAWNSITNANATEGSWALNWSIYVWNCSATYGPMSEDNGHVILNKTLIFTTKEGAPQPDLVAATATGTCANTESFTFNITATLDQSYEEGMNYEKANSCAVLDLDPKLPRPSANPCGATIDALSASSISSALTAMACTSFTPVVSCPPTPTATSGGERCSVGRMLWLAAALGWLVHFLVL